MEYKWLILDLVLQKKTRVLAMALDGQKKGLCAINSNKHVCDILSSAPLQLKDGDEEFLQVDINVDDYFALAELKVLFHHIDSYI